MTVIALAAPPSRCPAGLTAAIRQAVRRHGDWGQTAQRVAAALSAELPGPDILTAGQRRGDPDCYQTHLLHAEPDGAFSVVAVVWRPGQVTPIHITSPGASPACWRASNTRRSSASARTAAR
jgi:hypothetical protein